jgi:hypothetical protein
MALNDYIKKMIDSAKAPKQRNELNLANYVGIIDGLTFERRAGREKLGKAFWIDVVIEEGAKTADNEPSPAGAKFDFPLVLEGQFADMAFADLKAFFMGLKSCSETEVSKLWDELVDVVNDEGKHTLPNQPARGMRIYFETYARETKTGKNAGKKRVYPRWKRVSEITNSAEQIADGRAKLESFKK